jgi:hypothetical protein
MEKYGSLQLFPVKVQVPLIMSLRATMHVANIQLWSGGPASSSRRSHGQARNGAVQTVPPPEFDFWEPPAHYKLVTMDELDAEHLAKRAAAKRAARDKKEAVCRDKKRSEAGSGSSAHM